MIAGDMLSIKVSIWDSGCLPGLLEREISTAQVRLRVLGSQMSDEDRGQMGAYIGQLEVCLAATRKARAVAK